MMVRDKGSAPLRWLERIAIGLVALILLAVLAGSSYEVWMRRQAARQYPVPGKLVDLGGRRIQLDCRGSGSPTVVFESGLDMYGSLSWSAVHDPIARTTRACAYSRNGMMWSDSHEGLHDAEGIASDLHQTLQRAGEKPPFVLVGHSLGGPYIMAYTRLHGDEVAGLVFVDASHPDQQERLQAPLSAEKRKTQHAADQLEQRVLGLADSLSWTGAARLLVLVVEAEVNNSGVHHSPAEISALRESFMYLPQSIHSVREEGEAEERTFTEGGRLRWLGDRPLIVLTAAAPDPQAMGPDRSDDERMRQAWQALHDDEATWSTRSRHWLVHDAHHYIQFDRPDVVTRAVQEVVEAVRRGTALDPAGVSALAQVSDVSTPGGTHPVAAGSGEVVR